MKILLMGLISLSLHAKISLSLPDEFLSFKYQSFDGQIVQQCSHKKVNEWGDWDVTCAGGTNVFSVHLVLHKYSRASIPKTSYEILYWITNKKTMESSGATTWLHLNTDTSLNSINASQSTKGDTAGLYLDIKASRD